MVNTGAINAHMEIGTNEEALERNTTFDIADITTALSCEHYSKLP